MKKGIMIVHLNNLKQFVTNGNYYFNFNYNNNHFTLVYAGKGEKQKNAQIIILKRGSMQTLLLDLIDDFDIDAHNPNQYLEMRNFFEINSNPSDKKWNLLELYQYIDNHIKITNPNSEDKKVLGKHLPNPDAIYYYALVSHENDNKHRSIGNYQKTEMYYPDLAPLIKDKNVSVRFTSQKNDEKSWNKDI